MTRKPGDARARRIPKRLRHLHPEDALAQLESEKYADENAHEFSEENAERLVKLIATYPDANAQVQLERLRERFWGGSWKPRRKP